MHVTYPDPLAQNGIQARPDVQEKCLTGTVLDKDYLMLNRL